MGKDTENKPSLLSEFERCGNNGLKKRILREKLKWGQPGVSCPMETYRCLEFLEEKFISKRVPLKHTRFEIGPGGSKDDRTSLIKLFLEDKDVVELKGGEAPTIEIDHELLDPLDGKHQIKQKVYSCGKGTFMVVVEQPIWEAPDIVGMFLIKVNSAAGKNWRIFKPILRKA